eukprot:m.1390918 g.1390918  ORF g.1390918 m.1390918 type:complete len:343 (+) comp24989_c3_seq1:186-1214(+)
MPEDITPVPAPMPISIPTSDNSSGSAVISQEQPVPAVPPSISSEAVPTLDAVGTVDTLPSAAGLKQKVAKGTKAKKSKLSKKKTAAEDGDKASAADDDEAKGCRCLCRGMGPSYDCRTQFSASEQAMFAKIRSSSRTTKRNFIHSYALVNCKRGGDEDPVAAAGGGPTPGKSRQRMEYRLCQRKVCKAVFMELQGIGKKMIAAAQQHVRDGEITLKKTKRRPSRHVHVIQAEEFLESYAREHGTQQQDEDGKQKGVPSYVLNSTTQMKAVYKEYVKHQKKSQWYKDRIKSDAYKAHVLAREKAGKQPLNQYLTLPSFRRMWKDRFKHVEIAKKKVRKPPPSP